MVMKLTIHKQVDVFHPYHDEDIEAFNKLSENGLFVVDVKQSRNPKYHRRAMAIFRELLAMTDDEHRIGFEPWRRMMTVKAGYFTPIGKVDVNGTVTSTVIPDSLSFENFDDQEFRQVFKDILQAFGNKYGKQLTLEQLESWSRY